MKELQGRVVRANELNKDQRSQMYLLMDLFYERMSWSSFERDLSEKDYCILLENEEGIIRGFSTQQILSFTAGGKNVHGVFSGDTIIHRDDWGGQALFKVFAGFFFAYGEQWEHFYWFLISKGYKTYKMLPTFFREFYPDYRCGTPEKFKQLMHAFGRLKYPREYDEKSGVVVYGSKKDTLREGVADITKMRMRDGDVRFFAEQNPDYRKGNDLVCVTDLRRGNLKKGMEERLL